MEERERCYPFILSRTPQESSSCCEKDLATYFTVVNPSPFDGSLSQDIPKSRKNKANQYNTCLVQSIAHQAHFGLGTAFISRA
jgi:hypothetical protein